VGVVVLWRWRRQQRRRGCCRRLEEIEVEEVEEGM